MPTFCPKGSAVATRSSWELAPILRTRGPRRRAQVQTLQFLNHGGTLDYTYWDFAPNYSYVDAAAAAGYATFNYDRLGYGLSDHLLASGTRRARRYLPVTVALVGKYSADLDALIFTGILISIEPVGIAQIAFNLISASLDPSGRFNELDKGYLTQGAVAQDLLFPFHRYPDFDTKIFRKQFDTRQYTVFGVLLSFNSLIGPQPAYTGPVDVVLGQQDYILCQANCSFPTDQA